MQKKRRKCAQEAASAAHRIASQRKREGMCRRAHQHPHTHPINARIARASHAHLFAGAASTPAMRPSHAACTQKSQPSHCAPSKGAPWCHTRSHTRQYCRSRCSRVHMAQRSLPPGAGGGSGTRLKGGADAEAWPCEPPPPPEEWCAPLRERGGSGSSHELHSGPVDGSGSSLCAWRGKRRKEARKRCQTCHVSLNALSFVSVCGANECGVGGARAPRTRAPPPRPAAAPPARSQPRAPGRGVVVSSASKTQREKERARGVARKEKRK
jgi:hypothetical protein